MFDRYLISAGIVLVACSTLELLAFGECFPTHSPSPTPCALCFESHTFAASAWCFRSDLLKKEAEGEGDYWSQVGLCLMFTSRSPTAFFCSYSKNKEMRRLPLMQRSRISGMQRRMDLSRECEKRYGPERPTMLLM